MGNPDDEFCSECGEWLHLSKNYAYCQKCFDEVKMKERQRMANRIANYLNNSLHIPQKIAIKIAEELKG